jgi:hypothetical protein
MAQPGLNVANSRGDILSYREVYEQAVLCGLQVEARKAERTFCQRDPDDTDWEEKGIFQCALAPVVMQRIWILK